MLFTLQINPDRGHQTIASKELAIDHQHQQILRHGPLHEPFQVFLVAWGSRQPLDRAVISEGRIWSYMVAYGRMRRVRIIAAFGKWEISGHHKTTKTGRRTRKEHQAPGMDASPSIQSPPITLITLIYLDLP